ncbi:hypothetical protein E8P82_14725 [Arthrobacter echini]|uniref:Uncharacterized protein n=1 Tax=Arthrobacter echini TaxID=1529066 RepID=A0A4S5DZX8_9MICC|nr:hypothetical protein [Arthrobacter echini]THJ64588.1 hypothetical protein E8P82_14725 [Arthrobacter echini]
MIIVLTDTGKYTFDVKPTEVSNSGATLKIRRDGHTIAQFRSWHTWHEEEETPVTSTTNNRN